MMTGWPVSPLTVSFSATGGVLTGGVTDVLSLLLPVTIPINPRPAAAGIHQGITAADS